MASATRGSRHGDRWGLLGVVSPAALAVGGIVAASMTPGYSHYRQALSELAACGAPQAMLMRLGGLVPYGVLMAAFAIPLARGFGRQGRWAAIFVGFAGLCVVVAGLSPCDPGCRTGPDMSTAATVHTVSALLAFVGFIAAPCCLGAGFSMCARERSLFRFSRIMAGVSFVALVLLLVGGPAAASMGLRQRMFLGANGLWMAMLGLYLWRRSRGSGSSDQPTP